MASILKALFSLCATLSIAVLCVVSGFFVARLPICTELLSNQFSTNTVSPFSKAELTKAALATTDYTFGTHNKDNLFSTIHEINVSANTPYAQSTNYELENSVPEKYTLDSSAISHLDDCYDVMNTFMPYVYCLALIALVSCVFLGLLGGATSLGRGIKRSSWLVILLFVGLGVWGVINFNGLFTAFHSLFFASGTWIFSYDSLLICMYPESFWLGMGIIWLCTSILCSFIAYILGKIIASRGRN